MESIFLFYSLYALGLLILLHILLEVSLKVKNFGAECVFLTPNMMNTNVSCHVTDDITLVVAERCGKIQNDGVLDRYVEELRTVAKENSINVCDVYAKWKNMAKAGVDVTELLSNYVNHPIRELHNLTAMMLVDTLLEN